MLVVAPKGRRAVGEMPARGMDRPEARGGRRRRDQVTAKEPRGQPVQREDERPGASGLGLASLSHELHGFKEISFLN